MRKEDQIEYALKKVKLTGLSEKEKENALNEVRILASINNPNIIQYKEAFIDEESDSLCIVMEYANGGDLYQKITQHQKGNYSFEESEIWKIFVQIVKGLQSLHSLNIMHRDLKSANVFLNKDFSAKLGDMNVSKVANKNGLNFTQTGTPYYASPEVWKDEPYSNKSDIWSLGCVLYEMTTLKPPFNASDMQGLFRKVVKGHFPRIPKQYSQDLNFMIKQLLHVKAENRPSCEQIMMIPIFARRAEKYFPDYYNIEQSVLLKTIKIPQNQYDGENYFLNYLSQKLPQPNYMKDDLSDHSHEQPTHKVKLRDPQMQYPLYKFSSSVQKKISDSHLTLPSVQSVKNINQSQSQSPYISSHNKKKNPLQKSKPNLEKDKSLQPSLLKNHHQAPKPGSIILNQRTYESDYEEDNDFERDLEEEGHKKQGNKHIYKNQNSNEKVQKKKKINISKTQKKEDLITDQQESQRENYSTNKPKVNVSMKEKKHNDSQIEDEIREHQKIINNILNKHNIKPVNMGLNSKRANAFEKNIQKLTNVYAQHYNVGSTYQRMKRNLDQISPNAGSRIYQAYDGSLGNSKSKNERTDVSLPDIHIERYNYNRLPLELKIKQAKNLSSSPSFDGELNRNAAHRAILNSVSKSPDLKISKKKPGLQVDTTDLQNLRIDAIPKNYIARADLKKDQSQKRIRNYQIHNYSSLQRQKVSENSLHQVGGGPSAIKNDLLPQGQI